MICQTCQTEAVAGARFCSSCGAAFQPAEQTDAEEQARLAALRQSAEALIDTFMREVGIANPQEQADEEGWRYLNAGSAQGRVGVVNDSVNLYLQAEAHVMPLPSDGELIVPLMRELLEFNLNIAGIARVGIRGEGVFVLAAQQLPVEQPDVNRCINGVLLLADEIDDKLTATYGGTTKKRTRRS